MKEALEGKIRIGYIDGQAKRINERIVDGQWVQYLGEYAELVRISPFQMYKLFGGSVNHWLKRFPESIDQLAEGLKELCCKYQIQTMYLNLPAVIPYLLMARNYAGLDLGMLFIAHSVGSEFWLRQWVAIAPWLTERDVLITSTNSCQKALTQISDRYRATALIPLCIALPEQPISWQERSRNTLLSIGRIEDVKNIDLLLEAFAEMREQIADLKLIVAGEYTGTTGAQIEQYKLRLKMLIEQLNLQDCVEFTGAVYGERKDELFRNSDLLINLSTDPGETFGYNLIEAKAWGLPVICANWDGFQEIVVHGKDGYFIDCDWSDDCPMLNKQQIVSTTVSLLQNPELLSSFSKRSLEHAHSYDYKRIMPHIISTLGKAMEHIPAAEPEIMKVAQAKVSDMEQLFHIGRLQSVPFIHDRILVVAAEEPSIPLPTWMPRVKPIIHHFAGRC